ncbi:MAG: TIGR01212 family radical SAM protein [bacterium]|nr:TIGR01212 family radical SAM protein [bacterium]
MPALPEAWGGKRYYTVGEHYKRRFGRKVFKIALSVSQSCPNRQNDVGACVFCDEWGSAGIYVRPQLDLSAQMEQYKEGMKKRFKAQAFLAYFQPYTNTFARTKELEAQIRLALADPEVLGVILGTRPDCLNQSLFDLLRDLQKETYVSVELGVQSFDDAALTFLNRGHDAAQAIRAIERLKTETQVEVGVHLILGLPEEKETQVVAAAQRINQLQVDDVKLHNLHVLKNTPLEALYNQGQFLPLELEDYASSAVTFLEHLSPQVALGRLAAKATRAEELIAPAWTAEKMRPIRVIEQLLESRQTFQGRLCPEAPWN